MTYQVIHTTSYTYESEVSASYGDAHLLPRDMPGQLVVSAELSITPEPEHVRERADFFGNRATGFSINRGHTALEVTATSRVEVRGRGIGQLLATPPWEQVAASLSAASLGKPGVASDLADAVQFTLPSTLLPPSTPAAAYAMPSFRRGRPILEAVEDLSGRIFRDFSFKPGATTVSTPLTTVLARRAGVCQDFAHLTVAALRSVGLAGRYVSGYLETDPPPGKPKLVGADVSHAWASVFIPDLGWVDIDPTNDQFVGDRHITTAWGRDYRDVAPLRGIIFTDGDTDRLVVSVDVRKVDDGLVTTSGGRPQVSQQIQSQGGASGMAQQSQQQQSLGDRY
jgi:transglutaminase-like putative cysteine protease